MSRPRVSYVITDLDNTLYDWVGLWHASFSPLLESLIQHSGVSRAQLVAEIKAVHRLHKTSEHRFVIDELPSLVAQDRERKPSKRYGDAIERFRQGRNRTLRLYPGVKETLVQIRQAGTLIVAYTESMAFYTNYRIKHLDLDHLLDFVYSPADRDIPPNVDAVLYPAKPYDLAHAEHRSTPSGILKPSADVLRKILVELKAEPSQTVYIGDSLMKDVSMANELGVISVHAAYGESHDRPEYGLLKEVTHWTEEDVRREKAFKPGIASYRLEKSFNELLELFVFGKGSS